MKLLDRELLMKEASAWGERYNTVLVGEVVDLIEDTMCEVDAEPVVYGEWIDSGRYSYICSVCGENWVLTVGTPNENNMNYCPRCGAKMEEAR